MIKKFIVSADHVAPAYALDKATVEVRSNDDGATWYAVHRPHGCGRNAATPVAAIVELLHANGCTNVRADEIVESTPSARDIEFLKSEERFAEAGKLAFETGARRDYGCHYGMRSARDSAMAEFYAAYDAAAAEAGRMAVETVDMTPTWSGILPALMMALEHGTDEGKRIARVELERMARVADMTAKESHDAN